MLMRTDPFRELDRMAQQAFGAVGTLARPAVMPIDAWREDDTFVVELDLQEATVDGLTFEGCTLVAPTFGRGRYAALDLSGATLRSPVGLAGLKGATLSRSQVIDLADALALELGIVVVD